MESRSSYHVGPITLSKRHRDAVERRFQNPGTNRPIINESKVVSLLLGVDTSASPAVIIGFNALKRVGRSTRFSLFMPVNLIETAREKSWAEHFSSDNEHIVAFVPPLFPTYVEAVVAAVHLDPREVQNIAEASGVSNDGALGANERGRATVSRLIRDAKFSNRVQEAYDKRCAMCGLDHSLVVGAHIYPAAAPGSRDEIWNGLALCHNHHAAFDAHLIHVDASSRKILIHKGLHNDAENTPAAKAFIGTTFRVLAEPQEKRLRPRAEAFFDRYNFFNPRYDWV